MVGKAAVTDMDSELASLNKISDIIRFLISTQDCLKYGPGF
jgi:hypothetical protein